LIDASLDVFWTSLGDQLFHTGAKLPQPLAFRIDDNLITGPMR